MRDDKDKPVADAKAGVAAGMAGVMTGLSLGGTPATTIAGGVVGPAVLYARSLYQRAVQAREASAGRAAERAAELLGGLDILERESHADAERRELTAKVLEGAAQATTEEKLEALSQVLADGLRPGGDVGEATILALALRDLEGSHVRVLREMAEPIRGATNGVPFVLKAQPVKLATIVSRGRNDPVFDSVFAVLVRHGLVSDRPGSTLDIHKRYRPSTSGPQPKREDEEPAYRVTDVGYLCLKLLGDDVRAQERPKGRWPPPHLGR
ncbi:hypothetical protein [Actinomycetospora lemnae]|uniref:DUF4393 domain-containing protein n=1 Tax=Actinomycetospora lemnae TaxID=3019891 RepID=A0ABT5SX43_9PSEU|nr:hypothetical protein [Actinomycetospora sp. DW7H6]MDD7967296.1 hypothetical protein [Actinomycetospora sp. DW7H6]